ncbi:MAG: energy transducer TonB [Leptospiraceae bacterium]
MQTAIEHNSKIPEGYAKGPRPFFMRWLDAFSNISTGQWEDRILLAGGCVVFLFASSVSFLITEERDSRIVELFDRMMSSEQPSRSMVYPVLLEQDYAAPVTRSEKAALSDVNAGGSGGLTERYGFHTLSRDDVLQVSYGSTRSGQAVESGGGPGGGQSATEAAYQGFDSGDGPGGPPERNQSQQQNNQSRNNNNNERQATTGTNQQGQSDRATESMPMRIPANYRFQNDFAMRYDQSTSLSIPRRELEGYKYFRDLLRQVRSNFAPPGLNLVYRDSAGTVLSQPIKPQVVRVLFLIDEEGTVRDTRVVSSMGQRPVDQACVRSLEGHNFGPPPPEIFKHGNIFGISFIFPAIMNR